MTTKKNKSKKLWLKLFIALGVTGIVVACTLLPIYSCSGKSNPVTGKATFSNKKDNIDAFNETDIATITFTDVKNINDVSYELKSSENDFIHLEHVFKDGKHYIAAKSKPWLSATQKKVDVTVKALIKETVIGEMSQTIEITGQPVTKPVQPSSFAHTAGDSVETICSFDIPSIYKDIFKSYKAIALDATSGSTDSNYAITQKTIVENTVSFKLTSNINLPDQVKQLRISVVGVYDWQGTEDNISVFESSSFTATITHVLKPSAQITFSGSSFNSYETTSIATIAFTDVVNVDDVSYELKSSENDFIHLEHVLKDNKHYITAKSRPWLSATPKKVDVTVKALIKETLIGEMSQAFEITGQPITNFVQPSNFSHTAGDSVETICSFDVPPVYKDIFKSYKAVALDATSGSTDSNYTIVQKSIVGNTVSFKLTSNIDLQDQVKQLRISVVGTYDWQGAEDNISVFESSSFTATITHYQNPEVWIDFSNYTFESNEVSLMAKIRLAGIIGPETNLSFVLKGDDLGFFKLSYALIDGEHCVEAKSAPVTDDKSLINVQIVAFYNGNEVGSSAPTSIALKKLNISVDTIEDFSGVSGSVKKDYLWLYVGNDYGAQAVTNTVEIEAYLSPTGAKLTTYSFAKSGEIIPFKMYSVTLPVVTEDITQTIYFVIFGNYIDFNGKTQTIELGRTEVVTVTTIKS